MTTPVGIPPPLLAAETNLDDSYWLNQMRLELSDQPRWQQDQGPTDSITGGLSAISVPFMISRKPIWDLSPIYLQVTPAAGGVQPYIVVEDPALIDATHAYVNRNTGEIQFVSAPASPGTVQISYQWVKWSEQRILVALDAGMRDLGLRGFFKTFVDYLAQLKINQFEYPLPTWAQAPRARITRVEMKLIDVVTEDWREIIGWERLGDDRIRIPAANAWAPTAKIRISGEGPFQGLGDMDPEAFNVVKWYAKGMLAMDRDMVRAREDTAQPIKNDSASAPFYYSNVGRTYMSQYDKEIHKAHRPSRVRMHVRTRYR